MRDVSAFSHGEQVELANTDEEVLDMFSSYFEADVADAGNRSYFEADVADAGNRGSRISKENIDTDSTARCWMPSVLLYQPQASLLRPKRSQAVLMLSSLCTLAEQCAYACVFKSRFGPWTQSQFGPNLVEGQFGKMPGTMQEHNMSMQSIFTR